jgi:hypothetical protein
MRHYSATSPTAKLLGAAFLVLVLAAGCVGEGRGSYRATYVATYSDPPPPRYVEIYERPGYVWIDGRWDWTGSQWVWADGYYVRERPGYVYSQGNWRRNGSQWVWVTGGWRTRGHVEVREPRPHVHVRQQQGVRVEPRARVRVEPARPAVKVKVKAKAKGRVHVHGR